MEKNFCQKFHQSFLQTGLLLAQNSEKRQAYLLGCQVFHSTIFKPFSSEDKKVTLDQDNCYSNEGIEICCFNPRVVIEQLRKKGCRNIIGCSGTLHQNFGALECDGLFSSSDQKFLTNADVSKEYDANIQANFHFLGASVFPIVRLNAHQEAAIRQMALRSGTQWDLDSPVSLPSNTDKKTLPILIWLESLRQQFLHILELVKVVPGGMLFVFPSKSKKTLYYKLMKAFSNKNGSFEQQLNQYKPLYMDESSTTEDAKYSKTIKTAISAPDGKLTGATRFLVTRGSLSEGVDFADD